MAILCVLIATAASLVAVAVQWAVQGLTIGEFAFSYVVVGQGAFWTALGSAMLGRSLLRVPLR